MTFKEIVENTLKAFAKNTKNPFTENVNLPKGRTSLPDFKGTLDSLQESLEFVDTGYFKEMIPVIRKLLAINSSLSLAVVDNVQLCNPGYKIGFRNKVSSQKAAKARKHIEKVTKNWGIGTAGLNGIINKMMFQIFISGALSTEWIIKPDLSGIHYVAFLNAENIEIGYDHNANEYRYFQRINEKFWNKKKTKKTEKEVIGRIPLNPYTYKYYELINDQEHPVMIPPFLSVLSDLASQRKMLDNINFVTDQFGLMGFLELLMGKPSQREGESVGNYRKRLEDGLKQAKESIIEGLKDGVVAGYKNDHEFNFHSISKDLNGLPDIFEINHRMVSNGMFTSPSFQGGNVGGSETHINIIFTKMLSQLHNIQSIIKESLEYGLWLEVNLAGMPDVEPVIEFNKSTITDALKDAQAREIKIRNNRILYTDGIIDLDYYANDMGFLEPSQDKPRIPIDPDGILAKEAQRKEREKKKDGYERDSREKRKPQPKRKDND